MVDISMYCPFCEDKFSDICNKHPEFDNNGFPKLPLERNDLVKYPYIANLVNVGLFDID